MGWHATVTFAAWRTLPCWEPQPQHRDFFLSDISWCWQISCSCWERWRACIIWSETTYKEESSCRLWTCPGLCGRAGAAVKSFDLCFSSISSINGDQRNAMATGIVTTSSCVFHFTCTTSTQLLFYKIWTCFLLNCQDQPHSASLKFAEVKWKISWNNEPK